MKNINIKKKYIILIVLILLSVVVTTSFAYLGAQIIGGSIGTSSIITGNLELTVSDTSVNVTSLEPIYEEYYAIQAYKKTFTVTNSNSALNACTQIYLDLNTLSNELKSEHFKWKIMSSDNKQNEGNFTAAGTSEDFLLLESGFFTQGQTKSYTLYIWIAYDSNVDQSQLLGKSLQGVIKVKGSDVKERNVCELFDIAISSIKVDNELSSTPTSGTYYLTDYSCDKTGV